MNLFRSALQTVLRAGQRRSKPPGFRSEYEAGEDSHRRAAKPVTLLHEDEHLKKYRRKKLVATTRDAIRNFIRVGSATRKHLDFVAKHTPDFDTGDPGLDAALEEFTEERSKAENFDHSGRHDRDRFTRLAEARRCLDGDLFGLKLRSRKLQAIEGDRVRDPERRAQMPKNQRDGWVQGVRCDGSGRAVEYAIAKRGKGTQFEHERIVKASRVIPHLWHDTHFRFDAVRGVSPFAPGLNQFIDQHETITHAQAKIKLAQVLGLAVYSDSLDGLGVTDEDDPDETEERDEKYEVDLGRGPFKIELENGDKIDVLEGKTGAPEVVALLRFSADLCVEVLDLPPHFFDASRVNFHGGKVATTLYLLSAHAKRCEVQRWLTHWLRWQIAAAVPLGELTLPRSVPLQKVLNGFAWIPTSLPWFDRSREVRATLQAIAGGVDTYSRVIKEQYGLSFDRFLQIAKRDQEAIERAGVTFANFDKVIFLPDNQQPAEPAPAVTE